MHITQQKIIDLSKKYNLDNLGLREIGRLLGGEHPQTVKYHIKCLERNQSLRSRPTSLLFNNIQQQMQNQPVVVKIPVFGQANCGLPTSIAEQDNDKHISVSKTLLGQRESIFALEAIGDSMNLVSINGKSIENGDHVLVDNEQRNPASGDCIVSIIDDCANIKIFEYDETSGLVYLISKSTSKYSPIILDASDQFSINGKVFDVIKNTY